MPGVAATVNKAATILGEAFNVLLSILADNGTLLGPQAAMAIAKVGAMTTWVSGVSFTLTMAASHGITTGARLDIYWLDPTDGTQKYRYGCVVGTVATNSVPITGGSGDAMPNSVGLTISAMVPDAEVFTLIGNNCAGMAGKCDGVGTVVFAQADGTLIAAYTLTNGRAQSWFSSEAATNPLAGVTLGKVYFSHGDVTTPRSVQAAVLWN